MDGANGREPRNGNRNLPSEKVIEAVAIASALLQPAIALMPHMPDSLRLFFILMITAAAILSGLHFAHIGGGVRLRTVLLGSFCAILIVLITNVSANDWTDILAHFVSNQSKPYSGRIHVFHNNDNDNIQGPFEHPIAGVHVEVTFSVDDRPRDSGGYTDGNGNFDFDPGGRHAVTVTVCGFSRDDDGTRPPPNDAPTLLLFVPFGVSDEHLKDCVNAPHG